MGANLPGLTKTANNPDSYSSGRRYETLSNLSAVTVTAGGIK